MQFNVSVDCTPAEARSFLGLPDLTPIHDLYLSKMKEVAVDGVKPEDMERMFRLWSAGMSGGVEQWQKLFWQAASSMNPSGGPPAKR